MAKRLRMGIMGTGNIAGQFCTGTQASPVIALTSVGSRSIDAARAFAEKFRVPNARGSYDALLADREVDAIYLSLPNSMHHEWTIKALRAGKHVLCEKPLAVTSAEAQEMFDVSRQTGKILVEAFMYVSHPQTAKIIEIIKSGAIGELRLIRTSFSYRTSRMDGNIRFDPKLAGGALMDVGCYCTHFARMIAGQEPTSNNAVGSLHPSGVDHLTAGVLRFPSGVVATFSCGMLTQCDNSAHICGTEGYLEIPWPWKPQRQSSFNLAHSVPPRQDKGAKTQPPKQQFTVEAAGELYELEANDFAATVLDGAAPRLTESDSIGNMLVLEQVRKQIGLSF
jgi:D-xylose 1-dehydrogenase (NADP+, D-xylono-1,5-lactone-forming)